MNFDKIYTHAARMLDEISKFLDRNSFKDIEGFSPKKLEILTETLEIHKSHLESFITPYLQGDAAIKKVVVDYTNSTFQDYQEYEGEGLISIENLKEGAKTQADYLKNYKKTFISLTISYNQYNTSILLNDNEDGNLTKSFLSKNDFNVNGYLELHRLMSSEIERGRQSKKF